MDKSEKEEIKNLIDFGDSGKEPSEKPSKSDSEEKPNETQKIDLNAAPPEADNPDIAGTEEARTDVGTDMSETRVIKIVKPDDEADVPDPDIYDKNPAGTDTDGEEYSDEGGADDESEGSGDDEEERSEAGERLTGADMEYGYDFDGAYAEDGGEAPRGGTAKIVKRCVIAVAAIAAAVLFIITDTGIIGAYKRNFKHNFCKIFNIPETTTVTETTDVTEAADGDAAQDGNEPQAREAETGGSPGENEAVGSDGGVLEISDMSVKSSVIIPYESASESDYGAYRDGVICAATNYMCYINNKGAIEWEQTTTVIDPILDTAGPYILIAQKNGKKLCLYEGKELIYDIDCEDNILNADLSENGDCVLVTTKDLYKGAIAAYNKSGKLIYARSSGGGSVIDAAISPSSRDIAVTLLDTENAVRSTVEIFDITEDAPKASADFDDTILFDVEYFGNTINVFGDNSIAGLKSNGGIIYDLRFSDANIDHYAFDADGNKLLMLDAANIPTLTLYGLKGRQRSAFTTPQTAEYLCINDGRIMFNSGRDIIIGRSNGKSLERYTASMDVRGIIMLDRKTFFIVYSNSLELVRA